MVIKKKESLLYLFILTATLLPAFRGESCNGQAGDYFFRVYFKDKGELTRVHMLPENCSAVKP